MPSRFWKWFVGLLLTLVVVFVGFSGILLGAHYVTDVIAGYALGLAWAGLTYTLLERSLSGGTVQKCGKLIKEIHSWVFGLLACSNGCQRSD